MNILTTSERFSPEELEKIEAHYEATYVCESCIEDRRGVWVNQSVTIFYQSDPAKVPEGGITVVWSVLSSAVSPRFGRANSVVHCECP